MQAKIPLFKVFIGPTVGKSLLETLYSGYIGQGPKVDEFEKLLAHYFSTPYVMTVNSGTSALHLALRLANVRPGDEVISTPLTCTATNWPILAAGAKIVWADVDPQTANIDIDDIKKKITSKTAAIMVVDWGGQPVDVDKIRKVAYKEINGKKVKIPIIEDAAHAFGSIYKGKKVGHAADFTCFSFQAIKYLTTIDGGLLVVKRKSLYDKGKLLRWYGIDRSQKTIDSRIEVDVNDWGYKFHMNDVAATIGIEQLKYVDKLIDKSRANAEFYYEKLSNLKTITLLKPTPNSQSSYWIYTICVKYKSKFAKFMSDEMVSVSQVHRRNDTHPVVKKFKRYLPKLNSFEKQMICIPVGWWLTKRQREDIVTLLKRFDENVRN